MYDNFEVSSVYGFQLEKALVATVDKSTSSKVNLIAAMCMSRFANIKQTNGTSLIQMMVSGLLNTGRQLYDILDAPSNLNDVKLSFQESRNIFADIVPQENNNLWTLINRIKFSTQTIEFVFVTNYDISFFVPFDDVMKLALAFLTEYPKSLVELSEHKSRHCVYYVHISIIRLLQSLIEVKTFRSCIFGYIQSIVDIVNVVLSEENDSDSVLVKDYFRSLLVLVIQISDLDGINCLPSMTTLMLPLIESILSSKDYVSITLSIKLLCQIFQYYHDSGVNKCVEVCSKKIKCLLNMLVCNHTIDICAVTTNRFTEIIEMYNLSGKETEYFEECNESVVESDANNEENVLSSDVKTNDNSIIEEKMDVEALEEIKSDEHVSDELKNDYEIIDESKDIEEILNLEDAKDEYIEINLDKPLSVEDMLKSFVPF